MVRHTFLLAEGYWKARGVFRDEGNNEYPVNGETVIRHLANRWVNQGVMRVVAERPINFHNQYDIEPLQGDAAQTRWISHNAGLGPLYGTFKIEGRELVSHYQSAQDNYRGDERFAYQNDDEYKVEGVLYKGKKRISSWSVVLTRQSHAVASSGRSAQ